MATWCCRNRWTVHCRRTSWRLRSGPATRDTRGLPGIDRFCSRLVLADGWDSRPSPSAAYRPSIRLDICDRARRAQIHRGDTAALRHFVDFLRHDGVLRSKKVAPRPQSPVEREAHAFETYLRDERMLAEAT